jgi:8-oxo-dGTP pyrophosphatase MutT (NUDIX family)
MLDNLVAGGQPATLSIRENLEREAFEEAGIDGTSLRHATAAGQIAYRFDGPEGLVDSVVYPFDLEVGPAFQPRNSDGGIEAFYLLPIENVVELVRDTDEFKFNCALVIIDFLLRHDVLEPSAIAELEEVRSLLYASEPDAPSATREAV